MVKFSFLPIELVFREATTRFREWVENAASLPD